LATGVVPGASMGAASPAAAATVPSAKADAAIDYTRFTELFTSTEDDFGQDMPGAMAPSGLAKVNPMTTPGRSHSGYDYAEDQIAGFTQTNLDGVGGSGGGGDLLTVPTYVNYTKRPDTNSYAKTYSHEAEEATPGYYSVDLTTTQGTDGSISNTPGSAPIEAEMTAEVRSALQQYTFPNAGTASLVLDLRNNFTSRVDASLSVETLADGRASFSGYVVGHFNGNNYRLHYYSETTSPVKSVRTWGADGTLAATTERQGTDIGAIIDFDVEAGDEVGLTTTISPISVAQAKIDMVNELGERGFDEVRADTKAAWNEILGTVDVDASVTSDPDGSLKKLFYTHLYRLFGSPVNATSTTGSYRGADGVIYQADGYTHYDSWGLWDDFRKQSILAIAYPEVYADITQSLVDLYAEFANTSAGSLGNLEQSVPSVRYERASVVVADAVAKGVELQGLDLAFAGLKKQTGTGYNAENSALGYVANDVVNTMGNAYDDWAMAVIAEELGNTTEEAFYLDRATNYTNIFNTDAWTNSAGDEVGMINPKDAAGNWAANVNPEQFEGSGLYQGTLWQYNWYAANDMGGLIDLMGGEDNALSAVSNFFGEQDLNNGSLMLHSNANEIDLQAPYLFNYVGKPSSTQYWVRNTYTKETWNRYIATGSTHELPSSNGELTPPVKTKVFELAPDGFLPTMDNDTGMMSATYVAAAMGLFPVTAGSDSYQIGSPFFEKVTIDQPGDRSFTIEADGVSPDDFYIQSAELNGESLDRTWLTYDEIQAGGNVTFSMDDTASDWAADGPLAYSMNDHVDSSVYDLDGSNPVSRSSSVFTEADTNDGSIGNALTLTLRSGAPAGSAFAGADGTDLAASGAITAKEVPAGLGLKAVKTSATTVELSLTGKARGHAAADDLDDLTVTLTDSAFSGTVTGGAQSFELKVAFSGYSIATSETRIVADAEGAVSATSTLALQGGAHFSGTNGRDLIATNKASVVGLPAGLDATLVRTDATTATLSVTGSLEAIVSSSFHLELADSAFSDGVRARQVTGAGLTAVAPFTIAVASDWRNQLSAVYAEAHLVRQGSYSAESFATLAAAVAKAKTLLDTPASSDVALQQSFYTLNSALDGLVLGAGGYRTLEGEASNVWSGGDLKNEAINLGGIKSGSWVGYTGMDFSEGVPTGIDIRYVTNSTRSPEDSAVEIRANAPDGPLVTTVALPRSGPSWDAYTTVSGSFSDADALMEATSVYFVFRGDTAGVFPWVANLDSFQFTTGSANPEAPTVFEKLFATTATELHAGIDRLKTSFENLNNDEWAVYRGYDFGSAGADSFTVNYDKPAGRTPENTSVEIRLGSLDAPASETVPLTTTGSGWGTYNTITTDVDPAIFTGVQDMFIVFKAPAATSALPYVANVGWMQFAATPQETATSYRLEAESFTENSGGSLGVENSTGPDGVQYTNLKGTLNNDWLRYDGVNFGDKTATEVTVRYVNNSSRSGTNSRIELYLDSKDGEPFTTVPLPVTGNAWSAVGTTTFDLPAGITGEHTVFLVLRTEGDAGHPYVANIDWLDFSYGIDLSPLTDAIAEHAPLMELGDRYLAVDFRTFSRAFDAASALLSADDVTAEQLAEALRTLGLSAGQLEWKVIRQLAELVTIADQVDAAPYTADSYAALVAARDAARALPASTTFAGYQAAFAALESARADLALLPVVVDTEAPVITLPAENTIALGAAFDPMAGVSAADAIDGDLTASVTVSGIVVVDTAGSYVLNYRVADAAGNVGSAQRTVTVLVAEAPGDPTPGEPEVPTPDEPGEEPGTGTPEADLPSANQPGTDSPVTDPAGSTGSDSSNGSGDLASTGVQIGGFVSLAVLLLALGAFLLIRRRRSGATESN
jgi:predicted alpha-1,2-mannosidase